MFSPFLATIGAIFPFGLVMRRPPMVRVRRPRTAARGSGEPAGTVDAPTTSTAVTAPIEAHVEAPVRAHRSGRADLCIVAYVPSDATPTHLRAHPRIRNPFRAFPRRAADLVSLIEGQAPDA